MVNLRSLVGNPLTREFQQAILIRIEYLGVTLDAFSKDFSFDFDALQSWPRVLGLVGLGLRKGDWRGVRRFSSVKRGVGAMKASHEKFTCGGKVLPPKDGPIGRHRRLLFPTS